MAKDQEPRYQGEGTDASPLRPRVDNGSYLPFISNVSRDRIAGVGRGERLVLGMGKWTFVVQRMVEFPDEVCVYPVGDNEDPVYNISDVRWVAEVTQFLHSAFSKSMHGR